MHTLIPITSPLFLSGETLDERPDWATIFGNSNPLALEIGCGTGHFIAEMAKRHPAVNFIALDYYNKGCLKSCKRVESLGLANVRIVRDEARAFMSRCLHPESLYGVYINCPDPWPKRYQRKRRLVNELFIQNLGSYLVSDADFYFSTDFDDYGIDVARILARNPGFTNMLHPDLWKHDLEGYPRTKYMLKFMAEGKEIYFIHYRRSTERQKENNS